MRTIALALLIALAVPPSLFPLALTVKAQVREATERFSFVAPKAPKSIVDPDRFGIVLTRWSSDTERDAVFDSMTDSGAAAVLGALRDVASIGYVRWPGGVEYAVRYARRVPRPDGGSDIVLIADRPVWVWWDTSIVSKHDAPFTAIHIRVDKSGKGEGRVRYGDDVAADKTSGITLKDFAGAPVLMTDLRRESTAS
jgi:hypothetical protein